MSRLRARFSHGAASAALSPSFISTASISFLFILGVSIVVPLLPVIVSEYGVTRAGAGMLLSSFALGRLAFDILAGVLGDRFGIRRVAIVACVLTAVSSAYAATSPPYELLLVARFGQGVGSALYMTSAMRNVMDLAPEGHVGRLLAIYQGTILAGVSAGPMVGGVIAGAAGLRGTFLLYGSFALIGLALAWQLLPAGRPERGEAARAQGEEPERQSALVGRLVADPTFLLVLVATFAVFWARSGVGNTALPLLASERFGFSEGAIGVLLTVLVSGNLVVIAHAGRSVDRGRRSLLMRSLAATAPAMAAIALVAAPWGLFAAAAAIGALKGYASVVPGVVISDLADKRVRGTAIGIQRTMTDLGVLAGPVSAGALIDRFGFGPAFVVAGAVVAAVAVAATFMRETGPQPAAPPMGARLRSLCPAALRGRELP